MLIFKLKIISESDALTRRYGGRNWKMQGFCSRRFYTRTCCHGLVLLFRRNTVKRALCVSGDMWRCSLKVADSGSLARSSQWAAPNEMVNRKFSYSRITRVVIALISAVGTDRNFGGRNQPRWRIHEYKADAYRSILWVSTTTKIDTDCTRVKIAARYRRAWENRYPT